MSNCYDCGDCGCGGRGCLGGENCCWARAIAVKKFKKHVLVKYVFEVIFDVLVSVISVATDIASIGLYLQKSRWILAVVTTIPVLLPTIIFTNVYLADETQGYCKLPKHRKRAAAHSRTVSESDEKSSTSTTATAKVSSETKLEHFNSKMDFHCGTCFMLGNSCCGCWGGILKSICYKDESIRDDGMAMVRKSVKRILKYLFGTFVLRYISLAWYAKAFMFGIRAYKEPKKYMKVALPNTHWSYDLLVKLDFLQAALENAPQCIVQLYVLMVYPDENFVLAAFTLLFSFTDFVRVSISVQWDITKGPVIAPSGCYKSLMWKFINMSSWIFLYIGRSSALALAIATSHNWSTAIPVVILAVHIGLFAKVFSKAKYGVAAQKLFVSVFISVFFLPEFDTVEMPILTQFYLAVTHVENLFLIVPWNGMDYNYCNNNFRLGGGFGKPKTQEYNASDIKSVPPSDPTTGSSCIIDPIIIVIAVPALTMIGIVARLAASKKMSDYKRKIPPREDTYVMEERIANIYSKKWTSIGFEALFKAFLNMLKNDVIHSTADEGKRDEKASVGGEKPLFIISPSFRREFQASQKFIRAAMAMSSSFSEPEEGESFLQDVNMKTKRSMSVDAYGLTYRGKNAKNGDFNENNNNKSNYLGVEMPKRSKSQDDLNYEERRNKINLMQDVDIQFVKMECQDGPQFVEMTWI